MWKINKKGILTKDVEIKYYYRVVLGHKRKCDTDGNRDRIIYLKDEKRVIPFSQFEWGEDRKVKLKDILLYIKGTQGIKEIYEHYCKFNLVGDLIKSSKHKLIWQDRSV